MSTPTIEGLSATDFASAFRNHPAGVAVVTADAGDGPAGLTATSVFSVSAEPPLFVFSLASSSSSAPTIARAETVVMHLLAERQIGIARLFATSGVDRFADPDSWSRLPAGEPYLLGSPVWIRGLIVNRMESRLLHGGLRPRARGAGHAQRRGWATRLPRPNFGNGSVTIHCRRLM